MTTIQAFDAEPSGGRGTRAVAPARGHLSFDTGRSSLMRSTPAILLRVDRFARHTAAFFLTRGRYS
ncbi:MAG: hypothetical protein QOJ21_3083 [Solirubrobacteraceae bacterium]|nr:hypothetical protein [Solirubrobacteraceae bacterium]